MPSLGFVNAMECDVAQRAGTLAEQLALVQLGADTQRGRSAISVMTEGRWSASDPSKYAWCGDFVTYVLSRLYVGVRDGNICNRVDVNGFWKSGDNINRVVRWAQKHAALIDLDQAVFGDIIVLTANNGDHIGFFKQRISASGFVTMDGNGPGRKTGINPRTLKPASQLGGLKHVISVNKMPVGDDPEKFNAALAFGSALKAPSGDGVLNESV